MQKPKIKVNIATKIVGGFMAVLALLVAVAWISIVQVSKVDWAYTDLLQRRDIVIENVKQLKLEAAVQEKAVRGFLLTGDVQYKEEFAASRQTYHQTFEQFAATTPNEAAKQMVNNLKETYDEYIALMDQLISQQESSSSQAIDTLNSSKMKEIEANFNGQINKILEVARNTMDNDQLEAGDKTTFVIKMLIGATVIAILMGLVISLVISYLISKPVLKMSSAMERLAGGDFSMEPIKVTNRDEIGDMVHSMNQMVQDLGSMLAKVSESSEYLAASAEELSASSEENKSAASRVAQISQQNAAGSERQLESFRETTGKVDEIAAEVERIVLSSEGMLKATVHSAETTRKSVVYINDVDKKMKEIYATTEGTKAIIHSLDQHSQNISSVVSLITGISSQTNLLALNAAIEASRAGEHGRGFAVVAEEIRKLADESRRSAEEVVAIIELIQNEIEQAVESMEKESHLVTTSLASTNETREAFGIIEASMADVEQQVRSLSSSIEEIQSFSQEIAAEIERAGAVSEEGLQLSKESSAASEEQLALMTEAIQSVQNLAKLAEDMQSQIARFRF